MVPFEIYMKIQIAQMPIVELDVAFNLANMLSIIQEAATDVDLIVFPETTLTGFPSKEEITQASLGIDSDHIKILKEAALKSDVAIAFGFSEREGSSFYNSAMLVNRVGKTALKYRKTHLWPATDWGVFEAGYQYGICQIGDIKIGMLICYDVEFPETARALATLGADLILVLDGNMDPFGPVHRRAVTARAMENQCFVALVNRVGEGKGLTFPGESVIIDPFGEIVAAASGQQRMSVDLDIDLIRQSKAHYRYLDDRRPPPGASMHSTTEEGMETIISEIE